MKTETIGRMASKAMIVVAGLATMALVGCSTCPNHKDKAVAWDTMPAAVQATIQAHTDGGTVGKIEEESKHGHMIYEAKIEGKDGSRSKIEVREDGKLIEFKTKDGQQK